MRPIRRDGCAEHAALGEFGLGPEADAGKIDIPLRSRDVRVSRVRLERTDVDAGRRPVRDRRVTTGPNGAGHLDSTGRGSSPGRLSPQMARD